MWTKFLVFQAFALFPFSSAKQHPERTCPILGPAWPYPRDLRSSNTFQNATASLDAALDAAVKTGKLPYGSGSYNRTAFSVTLFSGLSDGLVHEYHHTPSFIFQSKIGTRKIDSDSIYRIASVSKALTAYLLLIRDGEAHLNTAVADLIPELKRVSYNSTTGVLIDWTQVTVADLMSQMSPLGYDYGWDSVPPAYIKSNAFPRIPSNQWPLCNYETHNNSYVGCTDEQLIEGIVTTPALFQPGHTPIYSNPGYDVFGLVLKAIVGAPVKEILEESLVKVLNLNGTSYTVPKTTNNSVIVPYDGSIAESEWYQELNTGNADGGYFTTSNDLAAIGRAILTNCQISAPKTNRWFKPKTFTSSPGSGLAVGAPWEIYRAGSDKYVYYLYTKGGDLATYHCMWVLVPDFNFGFTVLATGENDISIPGASLVVDEIMPALESVAQEQAQENLAGTYRAKNLNSSITFETDSNPGIKITEWISNGTDLLKIAAVDMFGAGLKHFDFRLYPNLLYTGDKVGFTGSLWSLPMHYKPGVFSDPCWSWTGPGGYPYGKVDIGNFVFDVERSGKAKLVRSEALRVDMERA